MAKRIGFIVIDETGQPKWLGKDGLFHAGYRHPVTIFRTEARAKRAIRLTTTFAAGIAAEWNIEKWRVMRVASEPERRPR